MATAENGFGKEGQIVEHLAVSRNTCAVAIRKRIHLVDLNRPENVLGRLDAPSSRWYALLRPRPLPLLSPDGLPRLFFSL